MKLGIKEFRERLSEVAHGDEPVIVTHHGRVLGRYLPERAGAPAKLDTEAWVSRLEELRDEWRAQTPDWRERMTSIGLDPDEDMLES